MAAIGSKEDFFERTKSLLTRGWFGETTPVLDGLIMGFAASRAFEFQQQVYVKKQQRLKTATDINLDMIAVQFFGEGKLPRKELESDDSYRARIHASLFRQRGTRRAVRDILTELTGVEPVIFEPGLTTDTGGYGAENETGDTHFAYDVDVGGYGAVDLPFQVFIDITRPRGVGIPNSQGLIAEGSAELAIGGLDEGAIQLADVDEGVVQLTDQDILDVLNKTMPAATRAWVRFV